MFSCRCSPAGLDQFGQHRFLERLERVNVAKERRLGRDHRFHDFGRQAVVGPAESVDQRLDARQAVPLSQAARAGL